MLALAATGSGDLSLVDDFFEVRGVANRHQIRMANRIIDIKPELCHRFVGRFSWQELDILRRFSFVLFEIVPSKFNNRRASTPIGADWQDDSKPDNVLTKGRWPYLVACHIPRTFSVSVAEPVRLIANREQINQGVCGFQGPMLAHD